MANVTETQLETYLRVFHDEYTSSVETYVAEDQRKRLLRYSLLPAAVIGYVSTQLGAGYEYRVGDPGISVRRGSQRIEELFVGAPSWLTRLGPFFNVGGANNGIQDITLDGGFPFRFGDKDADIYFYKVRFQAGSWSRDVLYAQLFANRSEEFWSRTEAVRRAKDEVLAALFDLQQTAARHVDLGTYLRTFKQKTVLLLGDFNRGRERLEVIRGALNRAGYHAVLLDEIPEAPDYDLSQKFQAVAAVCRFLVFEDSTAAGQIGEMFLAEGLRSIRIVLREGDQQSTFMTQGMGLTSKVTREWRYDAEDPDGVVAEAAAWAESVVAELAEGRTLTYPWRQEEADSDSDS